MDSFLMSRDRPREPAWLTSAEELVLFWLCLKVEMEWEFEPHWWWTPMANGYLMQHPCLSAGAECSIVWLCSNDDDR